MTLCVEKDKAYFNLLPSNPSFSPPTSWRICSFPHLCTYLNFFPWCVCVCVCLSLFSVACLVSLAYSILSLSPLVSVLCRSTLVSLLSSLVFLLSHWYLYSAFCLSPLLSLSLVAPLSAFSCLLSCLLCLTSISCTLYFRLSCVCLPCHSP